MKKINFILALLFAFISSSDAWANVIVVHEDTYKGKGLSLSSNELEKLSATDTIFLENLGISIVITQNADKTIKELEGKPGIFSLEKEGFSELHEYKSDATFENHDREKRFFWAQYSKNYNNYNFSKLTQAMEAGFKGEGVIAVFDTGVDITHPFIKEKLWTNPWETKDGTDTDGNGWVDDVHGINATAKMGEVILGLGIRAEDEIDDSEGHGTHVAGIASVVAPGIKILPVNINACGKPDNWPNSKRKPVLPDGGILSGIDYVIGLKNKGVDIRAINASFGRNFLVDSYQSGGALYTAFQALGDNGIAVITSAGNDNANLDVTDEYPAKLPMDHVITVGALDNIAVFYANETTKNPFKKADYSNYGSRIDIWANGGFYSAYPLDLTGYHDAKDEHKIAMSVGFLAGTSMASPFVAGAYMLMDGTLEEKVAKIKAETHLNFETLLGIAKTPAVEDSTLRFTVKPDGNPNLGKMRLAWTKIPNAKYYIINTAPNTEIDLEGGYENSKFNTVHNNIEIFSNMRYDLNPYFAKGEFSVSAKDNRPFFYKVTAYDENDVKIQGSETHTYIPVDNSVKHGDTVNSPVVFNWPELPTATEYKVKVNDKIYTAKTNNLSLELPNGNYTYEVEGFCHDISLGLSNYTADFVVSGTVDPVDPVKPDKVIPIVSDLNKDLMWNYTEGTTIGLDWSGWRSGDSYNLYLTDMTSNKTSALNLSKNKGYTQAGSSIDNIARIIGKTTLPVGKYQWKIESFSGTTKTGEITGKVSLSSKDGFAIEENKIFRGEKGKLSWESGKAPFFVKVTHGTTVSNYRVETRFIVLEGLTPGKYTVEVRDVDEAKMNAIGAFEVNHDTINSSGGGGCNVGSSSLSLMLLAPFLCLFKIK